MPEFKRCTPSDLDELRALAIETFAAAFGHLNSEENMRDYLARSFDPKTLLPQLENPLSEWYILHEGDECLGYIKLNLTPAQSDINDPDSLELERIYTAVGRKGLGIGRALIDKAIARAKELGKSYVWLGVWEENSSAIRFYRKCGFFEAGRHIFILGDEIQNDLILRRDL